MLVERIKLWFPRNAYSQEGEDLILQRMFETRNKGFYVDVGAHHPYRFSNTYLFYCRGWHGINIDATPGSMILFDKLRPRDINIEVGISKNEGVQTLYVFNEPALNTMDPDFAHKPRSERYKIIDEIEIQTKPLKDILSEFLDDNYQIDFLNVDAEGSDLQVLQSNDWESYRPEVVLVESSDFNIRKLQDDLIYNYMVSHHYQLIAATIHTLIFNNEV